MISIKYLDIDKSEWLEDIKHGDSSSASFMACVEECISERGSRKFKEGFNTKVKLDMCKRFGKSVDFNKYLHGICDAGSRLLFKFRSGTHGLNEELGRHRWREGKTECSLCGKVSNKYVRRYIGIAIPKSKQIKVVYYL